MCDNGLQFSASRQNHQNSPWMNFVLPALWLSGQAGGVRVLLYQRENKAFFFYKDALGLEEAVLITRECIRRQNDSETSNGRIERLFCALMIVARNFFLGK